jgi:hypothetical protein
MRFFSNVKKLKLSGMIVIPKSFKYYFCNNSNLTGIVIHKSKILSKNMILNTIISDLLNIKI